MKMLHAALTVHLLLVAPLVGMLAYFANDGHFILNSTLSHRLATLWAEGEPFTWMSIIAAPVAFTLSRLTRRQSVRISRKAQANDRRKPKPPLNAEFLFYFFLDKNNCDALVGDFEERYRVIFEKFDKGRADSWYWKQALDTVGPVAWAWAKKCAIKPFLAILVWAAGKGLLGGSSCVSAILEFWKRMRT